MSVEVVRSLSSPYPFDPPSVGEAFKAGIKAAGQPDAFAGTCPYDHQDAPHERRAWMNGFGVGRAQAA